MKKNDSMIMFKILRTIIAPVFHLMYNPRIIGKENIPKEGAIIVAGNHRHALDQHNVVIATKRPIRYIAKKEYFDGEASLFGKTNKLTCLISKWFVNACGCISVDRSIKDHEAVESAMEVLKNGGAIGIFPEGTRNKTDSFLQPFKFGTVSMAEKTNAYIVPFGITGTQKFRSKDLTIRIGKPFKVTGMNLEDANNKLYKTVEKLMKENLKEKKS